MASEQINLQLIEASFIQNPGSFEVKLFVLEALHIAEIYLDS